MISITTPLHAPGNRYIEETYRSLTRQSVSDWEWVILENHGGRVPEKILADKRVRVHAIELDGIGALKRALHELARGPHVVELDADDLLSPVALERVQETFGKGADFVHSDFAEFQDGTWQAKWEQYPYSAVYGWEHYPVEFDGHELLAMRAPTATAHNLRLIDWAPNHVRAWTKDAYRRAGGHDHKKMVADDHDLVVRFYLAGCRFEHVAECLYAYRVHADNTVASRNAEIRDGTMGVYNRHVWDLATKWCADTGLLKVDLCGGIDSPPGYFALDENVTGDGQCDLDKAWPLESNSVGLLRAHDAVEHLKDPVHVMNEAWRVLAPGGWLMIHVPSTNGLGAFCDPTHKSFWNKLSFRYYTDPNYARYVRKFHGRFQISRVLEWFPSEWHKAENVPYVEAHLIAVKDGFRAMGECLWV